MEEKEIWKDIPGYEGSYQASTFGRIKSLNYRGKIGEEVICKLPINKDGYYYKTMGPRHARKYFTVHQLIALTFLGYKQQGHKAVIDHLDDNKWNNRVENLKIVSVRHNTTKAYQNKKTSSEYTGVSKSREKWAARIWSNEDKKLLHLGVFNTEEKASEVYKKALTIILRDESL